MPAATRSSPASGAGARPARPVARPCPPSSAPTDDRDTLLLGLIENVAREQLTPVEEARAYAVLLDEFGLSLGDVAERVGRSKPSVSNRIRLLDLPDDVLGMLERGQLTEGHARAVLAVPDHEGRRRLAREIVQKGLSVRAAEQRAKWAGAKQKPRIRATPVDPALAARVRAALEHLTGCDARSAGPGRARRSPTSTSSPSSRHSRRFDRVLSRLVDRPRLARPPVRRGRSAGLPEPSSSALWRSARRRLASLACAVAVLSARALCHARQSSRHDLVEPVRADEVLLDRQQERLVLGELDQLVLRRLVEILVESDLGDEARGSPVVRETPSGGRSAGRPRSARSPRRTRGPRARERA